MNRDELEWKSEFAHNIWFLEAAKQGKHHPDKHRRDLMNVSRLRDDGKTYCNDCALSMVPYAMLPNEVKEYDRRLVQAQENMQEAWEESHNGRTASIIDPALYGKAGANLPVQAKPVASGK